MNGVGLSADLIGVAAIYTTWEATFRILTTNHETCADFYRKGPGLWLRKLDAEFKQQTPPKPPDIGWLMHYWRQTRSHYGQLRLFPPSPDELFSARGFSGATFRVGGIWYVQDTDGISRRHGSAVHTIPRTSNTKYFYVPERLLVLVLITERGDVSLVVPSEPDVLIPIHRGSEIVDYSEVGLIFLDRAGVMWDNPNLWRPTDQLIRRGQTSTSVRWPRVLRPREIQSLSGSRGRLSIHRDRTLVEDGIVVASSVQHILPGPHVIILVDPLTD